MERLQVRRARLAVLPVDMVHLDAVVIWEAQPTVPTPALWRGEHPRPCGAERWRPPLSCAPGHPIALVRTAMALDVDMPCHPHRAVRPKARRVRGRRRGGPGQAGAPSLPGAPGDPADRLTRRSPACPGAERDPGALIEPPGDGVPHPGAVVSGPAPAGGVERAPHQALRQGATACEAAPTLRQLVLHLGRGGGAQGVGPAASMASRALPRWGLAHARLPPGTPQERHPGVSALPGLAPATFGRMETQAPLGPPWRAQLLSVCKPLAVLGQPHAISGGGAHPSVWVDLRAGRRSPVQGQQRQPRCTTAALGRPSWRRPAVSIFQAARLPPGCAGSAPAGRRLPFGPYGRMGDPRAAWGPIDVERLWRSVSPRRTAGAEGLMTGPSRAKARGRGGELGCPCGFEGLTHAGWASALRLGGHAERAVVRGGAPGGPPEASERAGGVVETERVGSAPSLRRWAGLDPVAPRRGSSSVSLRAATPRQ
jgi:hypothetical protein